MLSIMFCRFPCLQLYARVDRDFLLKKFQRQLAASNRAPSIQGLMQGQDILGGSVNDRVVELYHMSNRAQIFGLKMLVEIESCGERASFVKATCSNSNADRLLVFSCLLIACRFCIGVLSFDMNRGFVRSHLILYIFPLLAIGLIVLFHLNYKYSQSYLESFVRKFLDEAEAEYRSLVQVN